MLHAVLLADMLTPLVQHAKANLEHTHTKMTARKGSHHKKHVSVQVLNQKTRVCVQMQILQRKV